ncbi:RabGAP/TBC [Rhizopus microsporus]|uniref:RabGAP/TBC n=1 Tax=Rhizopus microsporus TaxID=58291 RepID=A0A1X0RRN1_RHIZD|nr:RabGAP/TBC [Rhizopus microsporus]
MAVDTNRSCPPVPIWIELSKAQEQVERDNNNHPPLTSGSSDTDYTIITAASSIRTSLSLRDKREIIQQYEQRPEKTPDIASEMEKWYAMTDRYGFLNTQQTESDSILLKEKEIERAEKWAAMSHRILIDGETAYTFSYSSKLRRRVYKGIPDCWRRDVWYYLVTDGLRSAKEDYAYKKSYQELLLKESPHERQIDLDIPRTLRDHIMFKQRYGSGQRALFNVLRAFSNYDEEVGYCQGMTNIVATILMYCDEEVI